MNDQNKDTLITLDMSKDELLTLCLMAHKEDITLNELVNKILIDYVYMYKDDLEEETFEESFIPPTTDEIMEAMIEENEQPDIKGVEAHITSFKSSFNSFHDFVDLCDALYLLIPFNDRKDIESVTEETFDRYLAQVHHSYGRWLRNRLSLWDPDNEIVKWFDSQYNLTHADDLSSIIIAGIIFRNRLQTRNRVIVNLVQDFHKHWREMNAIFDGDNDPIRG